MVCGFRWLVCKFGSTTTHRIRSIVQDTCSRVHTDVVIRKTMAKSSVTAGRSHDSKHYVTEASRRGVVSGARGAGVLAASTGVETARGSTRLADRSLSMWVIESTVPTDPGTSQRSDDWKTGDFGRRSSQEVPS